MWTPKETQTPVIITGSHKTGYLDKIPSMPTKANIAFKDMSRTS